MTLNFHKLVGAGNDFVFFHHDPTLNDKEYSLLSQKLCDRHFGIGADGIVGMEPLDAERKTFRWHFFNSDGSTAEMCGNAARCAVRYAAEVYDSAEICFETLCGQVTGKQIDDWIQCQWSLKSTHLEERSLSLSSGRKISGSFINTGVPHFVILDAKDTLSLADCLEIQNHKEFQPAATNVTLLDIEPNLNKTRTFERGVRNFTLACGTGVIASAFVLKTVQANQEYHLQAPGGSMTVQIDGHEVQLTGPADIVYSGEIHL